SFFLARVIITDRLVGFFVPRRMSMIRFARPIILAALLAMGGYQPTAAQEKPAAPEALKAEIEALKSSNTVLVGGHAIDLSCGVRYGMIGEPVAADEAGDAEAPEERPQEVPAEAGRQLMETLGPAFMVFRDKVQEELKLSDE